MGSWCVRAPGVCARRFTTAQIVSELGRSYPEEDIRHTLQAIERIPRIAARDPARLALELSLWGFLLAKSAALAGAFMGSARFEGLGVVFFALSPLADVIALSLFYRLNRATYIGIGLTLVVFMPAFTGFNETLGERAWLDGNAAATLYALALASCAILIRRDATVLSVRDILREDGLL